ncbi:cytochrome b [Aureimonas sp. SK2]|uniref:cytochrome b n=1 Tax=Aureimonas sp. SK2 TaxID=3015992 RepID=UPI002444ED77|nr:cytochrome b [Aureimonas sp. SK2]
MEPSVTGYRTPARILHWTVAILVLALVPVGLVMTGDGIARGLQDTLFIAHKNLGTVVLVLMLARIAYRLTHRPPPLPAGLPPLQRRVAAAVHGVLYLVLAVMAVSGFVRVQAGGFPIELLDALGLPPLVPRSDAVAETAKRIHVLTHYPLIALIALHIAGAIHHAAVRRDGLIRRMWPPVAP